MEMFTKILFPVDLSEISHEIIPYVLTLAEKFNAEIHLIYVASVFGHFKAVYVPNLSVEQLEKEIVQGAERKIKEFAKEFVEPRRHCRTRVATGDTAEEIIKYVEAEGIDLIVIGTHGRKGISRFVFGSVAEKVVKTCPVPVLSIKPSTVVPE